MPSVMCSRPLLWTATRSMYTGRCDNCDSCTKRKTPEKDVDRLVIRYIGLVVSQGFM